MLIIYVFLFLLFVILVVSLYFLLKTDDMKNKIEYVDKLDLNDVKFLVKSSYVDGDIFVNWLKDLKIKNKRFLDLRSELDKLIVWLDELKNSIIVWILSNWHLLVEWAPGLAKTKTILTISKVLDMDFRRIQFTPDMMPSDILGSQIYNQKKWDFEVKIWPIFTNVLLADEINRATPKVQSALLEAMQERKINISWEEFDLPSPFFVLATQNPLEQEWTYPLPEAQLDRFLFKVLVNYPDFDKEKQMLDIIEEEYDIELNKVLSQNELLEFQKEIQNISCSSAIKEYIVRLVESTRKPDPKIVYWISPRWSISMLMAAKAVAFLKDRDYVDYEDVQQVALLATRHRVIISYDAKIDGYTEDDILVDKFRRIEY